MWGGRPQFGTDSEMSMAWNQWAMLYRPMVSSEAWFAPQQPQTSLDLRMRTASLPLFPQPVYPMSRHRLSHPFEHQGVTGGQVMAFAPHHASCQQCTAAGLAPNLRPTGHKQDVDAVPRLQTNEHRHPVASQYPVERFITERERVSSRTETTSDRGSEGDDEMSGQEAHTAVASESCGASTLSSHSSGDINTNDGRLTVQGPSILQGLNEEQESQPQARTDSRNQECPNCHFYTQELPSPDVSKQHLCSDSCSPERCRKCGHNMTYQAVDRESIHSEGTDSQEKRGLFPQTGSMSVGTDDEISGDTKKGKQSSPKCAYCERRFVNRAVRDQHARQCEGNPYRCAQCGKACLGRVKLERHMRSHSRSRLSTLKAQEIARSKHGRAPDPKCAYCQRRFPTRVVRDRHSRLCSSNPYKCPQCGKAFLGMAKLERHIRTHSEVRTSQAIGVSTQAHSPVNAQGISVQSPEESEVSLTPTSSKSDGIARAKVSAFSHSIESILQIDGP